MERHLRRQLAPLLFSEEGEPQQAGGTAAADGSCPAQGSHAQDGGWELAGAEPSGPVGGAGGSLSAVELRYEQVSGYAPPTLSELEPLHERVFDLLGVQPHPAPARSKPPASAANAPPKTPT